MLILIVPLFTVQGGWQGNVLVFPLHQGLEWWQLWLYNTYVWRWQLLLVPNAMGRVQ